MRRYWPCLLFSAGIFLSGCASSSSDSSSMATDGVVSKSACQQKKHQQQLAQNLRGEGIQVVQVGEETTLVLPTKDFFNVNSNHMLDNTSVLDDIVSFINAYPTVNIQVVGYPKCWKNSVRSLALSRAQAQEIANYLGEHGLNTRLISADAKNTFNEAPRIEIFFRLPAPADVFH